jgi:hypothetical protein
MHSKSGGGVRRSQHERFGLQLVGGYSPIARLRAE